MRIDFLSLDLTFPITKNRLNQIQLEEHDFFDRAVQALCCGISNTDDSVRLWSDENEHIDLSKNVDVIVSPKDLSYSGTEYRKKIIKLLISELECEQYSDFINSAYSDSLDVLEQAVVMSDYLVEYEPYIQIEKFLKMIDIHLKEPEGTFIERVCEYIHNTHKLLGKEMFILANCSAYLRQCDYTQLQALIDGEAVTVILFETQDVDEPIDTISKKYIVDDDLCELYL